MRLKNQIVWITGSAKRVGREIALQCAHEGADIVVHCRSSRADGERTAKDISDIGRRSILVQGDQGKREDVMRMVKEIEDAMGGLTALVNCASVFPQSRFEAIREEDFFSVIRSNLYGPFLCAQLAAPLLRKAAPGRIVNMTDWSVRRPYKNYAHYMAAKGGLHTLTMALARELAPDILVNAIAPGAVLEDPKLDDKTRRIILEKIPLHRWGKPADVAKAVLFLLESNYVCGETIAVDGGRTIG